MATIGNRIKLLAKEKNVNNKEIALFLNMSSAGVGKYINNITVPNADKIEKLAHYFNVSCDYLVLGSDEFLTELERVLILSFRELDTPNQLKVIKETTGLEAIQSFEHKKKTTA